MNLQGLQSYSEREVQEILRLAGVARRKMDYFTREDMVRAAAEIGVPESAVIEAEQLVRERQSEADDRAEYRRKQGAELAKGLALGVPFLAVIIFGHAIHFFGNFFSIGKGVLKPLGGVLFSRSTQHELDFQDWRNKRYRKVMNVVEPSTPTGPFVAYETDIAYSIRHRKAKLAKTAAAREKVDRVFAEADVMSEALDETGSRVRQTGIRTDDISTR